MADIRLTQLPILIVGTRSAADINEIGSEVLGDQWSREGDGGAVVGGEALDSIYVPPQVYDEVGSGGVVCGGSGLIGGSSTVIGDGGVVSGESAIVDTILNPNDSSAGVVAGGTGVPPSEEEFVSGGIVAGGEALVSFFDEISGDGGAVVGGEANLPNYYTEASSGGAILGGLADSDIVVQGGVVASGSGQDTLYATEVTTGGVVLGGTSSEVEYNEIGSGGITAAGLAIESLEFIGFGGALLGGEASSFLIANEQVGLGDLEAGGDSPNGMYDDVTDEISGGALVNGSSILFIGKSYDAQGGVALVSGATVEQSYIYVSDGMSGDAPPDYSGVTVGYLNHQNPTLVNYSFDLDIGIPWRTDRAFEVDTRVSWNTGVLRQYFYRIIGKAKEVDRCDPIQVGEECCKLFMMNIHARTITELCEVLKARRWKWPIQSVQKFSRPAENAAVREDEALGINHDCNILEEVEICDNVVCAEFCVDFDVRETWGYDSKTQVDAFYQFVGGGELSIGGASGISVIYDDTYEYTAVGGLILDGSAHALGPLKGSGGITVGGVNNSWRRPDTAANESSSWYFVGGERVLDRTRSPRDTDFFVEDVSDRVWTNPDFGRISDSNWAVSDISQSVPSGYLVVKDFGFSDISAFRHQILGFEVTIERNASIPAVDAGIYLVVGDEIVSDDMSDTNTWPIGMDATKIYGGPFNNWRDPESLDYIGEWSPNDVNSPEFGVAIRVRGAIGSPTAQASINSVVVKVYYETIQSAILNVSGEAKMQSSAYTWVSDGGLLLTSGTARAREGNRFVSDGRGSMGPDFGGITISGSYIRAIRYNAGGIITLGGTAELWPGGTTMGGSAKIETSSNYHISSGELVLASENRIRVRRKYNIVTSSPIVLAGDAEFNNRYRFTSDGGLNLSGSARGRSTAYTWNSDGNVLFILGAATYNFSNFGTFFTDMGLDTKARDLKIIYNPETTTPQIEVNNDRVNECGCANMRLTMPFTQNLAVSNKFSQFLSRNNIAFPTNLEMRYNRINDNWLNNYRYVGYDSSGNSKESWNMIFSLGCTNVVAGQVVENRIWKFTMQIVQQNLVTMADYDLRLVIGFKPERTCIEGFRVSIQANTQSNSVVLDSDITLYEYKLYDNISLFKNAYWISNPILRFEISQVGLATPIPRQEVKVL